MTSSAERQACRHGRNDLLTQFGAEYGLLPVYALIIAFAGFSAHSLKHLLMMLGISSGVYIAMFRAFDLKKNLDIWACRTASVCPTTRPMESRRGFMCSASALRFMA